MAIVLLQGAENASVQVQGRTLGRVERGLLAYVALERDDSAQGLDGVARALLGARVLPDERGRLNRALREDEGLMMIPQFTLAGQVSGGGRVDFGRAAPAESARGLFDALVQRVRQRFGGQVAVGAFGAHMQVSNLNPGPLSYVLRVREGGGDG